MAFRQPTYHAPQRTYTPANQSQLDTQAVLSSRDVDESQDQEWVLFSPGTASTVTRTQTASTERVSRTPGRSRISDYGSLDTASRSYEYDETESEGTEGAVEDEEDGELDSLDSHLHAFGAEPSVYRENSEGGMKSSGNPLLPTHDGLGSFRIDQSARAEGIQEHLYAFERHNPHRVKRRKESLDLGELELQNERAAEAERTRRIEEWRMEQSRVLLNEIQKETRRRKQSMSSERRSLLDGGEEEEIATLSVVRTNTILQADEQVEDENDSFWNRITRSVIRDLMGIDDKLLSIIFGEELPEDVDLSTTPLAGHSTMPQSSVSTSTNGTDWEHRLLERVARELGILVSQLSEHPGAFSTYLQTKTQPLPYAGLPIIPEARDVASNPSAHALSSPPVFEPTLQPITEPLGISSLTEEGKPSEEDATPHASFTQQANSELEEESLQREKAHWEQDLDLKLVFHYLRSRFGSRAYSNTPSHNHESSRLTASSSQDIAARAARVRQHHPLVSRQRPVERRSLRATSFTGSGLGGLGVRRGSSSCASQSTKGRRGSGSSRNYWDIGGGSIGSGSLLASTGGMGSWGEV